MKSRLIRFVFTLGLLISTFLAAPLLFASTDALGIDQYYRESVFEKESGVYEFEGEIIFQTVVDYDKNSNTARNQAKARAMLDSKEQIKQWMLQYTAEARAKASVLSPGQTFARMRLDAAYPGWQFSDFDVNFATRMLHNRAVQGRYVHSVCVNKETLIANIPEFFATPCSAEVLSAYLPKLTKFLLAGESRKRFLRDCGAFDLVEMDETAPLAAAYEAINEKIRDYWESSEFIKGLQQEIQTLEVPQTTVKEIEETNDAKTVTTKRVETVTVVRNPRMQKLMVLWESEKNFPLPPTTFGTQVKKTILSRQKSPDESIQLLKEALAENPGDKELWNLFGRLLMLKEEPLLAVVAYRNALKLDPEFIYPMVNLAYAYRELGEKELGFGLMVVLNGFDLDAWSAKNVSALLMAE